MDRFQEMQVFVAVAEESGFAAAARRLGQSAPAVTRAVASLEERLGIRLLSRTTRHVRTTEAGVRFLEDARRILTDLEAAQAAAMGVNAEPRGRLSVTAPVLFGRRYVMPGIVGYLNQYPDMSVDAFFLDRPVNLLEEGWDVGIRIGELPDSSLHARKLGEVRQCLVASPEYIEARGIPASPETLQEHQLVASNAGDFGAAWRFRYPTGEQSVRIRPRLTVTSNDAALAAAVVGFGITRLLSYQAADALAEGQLVTLLDDFAPNPIPVSIIHRAGPHSPNKIRTFIDFMVDTLRPKLEVLQ